MEFQCGKFLWNFGMDFCVDNIYGFSEWIFSVEIENFSGISEWISLWNIFMEFLNGFLVLKISMEFRNGFPCGKFI